MLEIRYKVIAPIRLKNNPTIKSVYPIAVLKSMPYIFVSIKVYSRPVPADKDPFKNPIINSKIY